MNLSPTEHLVLDVMAARYHLGHDSWTFPAEIRPSLENLASRGYLIGTVGVHLHAWLTDEGAKYLKLDQPYIVNGTQCGRIWESALLAAGRQLADEMAAEDGPVTDEELETLRKVWPPERDT